MGTAVLPTTSMLLCYENIFHDARFSSRTRADEFTLCSCPQRLKRYDATRECDNFYRKFTKREVSWPVLLLFFRANGWETGAGMLIVTASPPQAIR